MGRRFGRRFGFKSCDLLGDGLKLDSKATGCRFAFGAREKRSPAFFEAKTIEFRVGSVYNATPGIARKIFVETILDAKHMEIEELDICCVETEINKVCKIDGNEGFSEPLNFLAEISEISLENLDIAPRYSR
jgi:hypothetical protein